MPAVDVDAPPVTAACGPWCTPDDICGLPTSAGDALVARSIASGSWLVWALTGRQFGTCTTTVRPCRECDNDRGLLGWHDLLRANYLLSLDDALSYGYPWRLTCHCGSHRQCGHRLAVVALPAPVLSVVQVVQNGIVLDPSAYRVDDRRWLVRLDGEQWPATQNLALDLSESDTFGVTVVRGVPVPQPGVTAAAALSLEFIKSCLPGVECRLPERVTTITRQGMTVAMLDPMDFLEKGRTGIAEVDQFIAAANPHGLTRRPSVRSAEDLTRHDRFDT